MADEFYREEIIFDVNDEDAIRRAKRAEKRIKETMERTRRRAKALGRVQASPVIKVRDKMTRKVNRAERLIKTLSTKKAAPVIAAKDRVSGVVKKTNKMLDALSRSDVKVQARMKGTLVKDIQEARVDLESMDTSRFGPRAFLKGSLLRELNRAENLIRDIGTSRARPRVTLRENVMNKMREIRSGLRKVSSRAWEITITAKDRTFAVFRKIRGSVSRLRDMMTSMPVMFGAGAVAAAPAILGVQAVNAAAGFEQSMARVKAVSGATGEQFRELNDIAREMGRTTEYTASQSADALGYLSMAGFEATESVKALPATLDLATAGQLDLARTADIASNVLSGFRYDIDDYQRVVDVIAKTQSTANTNVEQLGNALSYAAPAAADAGQSIETAAAAIGLVSDAGIQGERAGTSLRNIFSQLIDPTSTAREEMDKLGVSVMDSSGELKDLPDIIKAAERAGIKGSEAYKIFGQEAGPGFSQLLAVGSESLADYIQEMENSEGAAKNAADTMRNTLQGSIKTLGSAWESLLISIGGEKGLGPAARSFVDNLTEQFGRLETFVQDNQQAIEDFASSLSSKMNAGIELVVDVVTSDEFKNADLFGKASIAWDEFVSQPFADWYQSGGRAQIEETSNTIGENMGTFITEALTGLLGESDEITSAGGSAATEFIEGFKENFDLGKVVSAGFSGLKNTYSSTFESTGNMIGTVIATAAITKIGKMLGGGMLLKGLGKAGKGILKGGKGKGRGGKGGGPKGGPPVATGTRSSGKTSGETRSSRRATGKGAAGVIGKAKGALKKVPVLGGLLSGAEILSAKGGRAKSKAAGGAAGGMGGAAAGAAIGSIVPGVGTAAGGLAGGILGSIGGDSIGRVIGGKGFDLAKKFNFGKAKKQTANFTSDFGSKIKSIPQKASNFLGGLSGKFGNWFGKAKKSSTNEMTGLSRGVGNEVGKVPSKSSSILSPLGGLFGGLMGSASRSGVTGAKGLPSGVGSVLGRLPGMSYGLLGPLAGTFGGLMGSASRSGVSGVRGMPRGIGGVLGGLPGMSYGLLGPLSGIFGTSMKSAERSGVSGVRGMPGGVGGILGRLPAVSGGRLGPLAPLFSGYMKSAERSGISGVRGMPSGVAGIIARIAPSASSVFSGLLGTFRSWGARLSGAVTSAFNKAKSTASSLGGAISSGASWIKNKITPHAEGGILDRPHVGLVAEDGPESIIPLSSKRRGRALDIWEKTGQALGVKPYAQGGIVGGSAPVKEVPNYRVPEPSSSQPAQATPQFSFDFNGMEVNVNVGTSDIEEHMDEIVDEASYQISKELRAALKNKSGK